MKRRALLAVAVTALLAAWLALPAAPPPAPAPAPAPAPPPLAAPEVVRAAPEVVRAVPPPAIPRAAAPVPDAQPEPTPTVRCTLDLDHAPTDLTFLPAPPLGEPWEEAPVSLDGTTLQLEADPAGRGTLYVPGYAPVHFRWKGGRCLEPLRPEPLVAWAEVRVRGDVPDEALWVRSCEGRSRPSDGHASFGFTSAGPCTFRTLRRGGALEAPGPPVEVELVAGETVEVVLDVADFEPAGMGITLEEVEGGIGVARVLPGTPAQAAGLAVGDTILAIDGVPAADLTAEDFVELGVGPIGTEVVLEVAGEDGIREVVLLRDHIEPP